MGKILSRFRTKKSTVQTLEKLENEIKEREKWKSDYLTRQEKISKSLLFYVVGAFVLCFFVLYLLSSVLIWKINFFSCLALFFPPYLIYIVGKLFSWYNIHSINKYQMQLNKKNEEKNRILDEVKKTETYNSAKEILDKFSSESVAKVDLQVSTIPNTNLRKRSVVVPNLITNRQTGIFKRSPIVPEKPKEEAKVTQRDPVVSNNMLVVRAPTLPLPAPVFPIQRSYLDRAVEYLLGDGPNNRYALICSCCHSHNGMALKEEFEYVSFKCCYCFFYNPAKKIRPEAPKLEGPFKINHTSDSDSDSRSTQSDESSKAEKITKEKKNSEANSTDEDFEELQLPVNDNGLRSEAPEPGENEKSEKSLENDKVKDS